MERKTLGIAQVLEMTSKQKTKQEKIAFLQANFSATLADVLILGLHPSVKWLLPEGAPPYNKNDMDNQEFVMFRQVKKLYMFLDGGGNHLKQLQREKIFVDVLQSLAPADAELLISIKDKKLPYGLTADLIREALPQLNLPEPAQA
jgi:hypothetical protein